MYDVTNIFLLFMAILLIAIISRLKCKNECDRAMCKANIEGLDRQFASDVTIINLLDQFIMKQFDELILLNIDYAQLEYIKDTDIKKLQTELANSVSNKISSAFINTLTLIYNKDALSSIISERCYMVVINWAREKNNLYTDKQNNKTTTIM